MKKFFLLLLVLGTAGLGAQPQTVTTVKDSQGWKLQIDGSDFAVKGVVWSYTPIGENYTYDLWAQPEEYITKVIDTDMTLLKAMGANAIRVFSIVPAPWIEYIYDRYGIYTMVNDQFGRYGITVDGRWQFPTDYSDPATRRTLLAQAKKTFETFKDTRGVLMYMLGNESNYGLEWTSAVIENLPGGERSEYKAKALYSLFEEAIALGKTIDSHHPMGLVNGDLQYLRIMKDLVPSLDILGVNTYRGPQSYAAFYNSIAKDLDKPFVYTELGADAYNVGTEQEDQDNQARLLKSQWREIYDQSYGKGRAANALGAFVFEWMDEWWKAGMETGLGVHDTNGTWNNGGYAFDAIPGRNNMNEEWFGIVGMSTHTVDGVARRLPRTAYFLLQDLWRLDLYTSTRDAVAKKFDGADFSAASLQGNVLAQRDGTTNPLPSFVPHGSLTSRTWWKGNDFTWQKDGREGLTVLTQSTLLAGGELRGAEGLTGSLKVRVFPERPALDPAIDHVDPVEAAGKTELVDPNDETKGLRYSQPVELYQATISYDSKELSATFHYHDGHPDWAAEGDFFGLLPEAFDLFSPDKEGTKAPFGLEVSSPLLPGLKIYAGPEIFWGAQPRVMAKYSQTFGSFSLNLMHDEEYGLSSKAETVAAKTADRWTSASFDLNLPRVIRVEAGALMGEYNRVNIASHSYEKVENGLLKTGVLFTWMDTLAGKVRVTSDFLPYLKATVQYLYAGVLADTRAAIPREGSQLFDVGTGNRSEFLGTLQGTYGDFVLRTSVLSRQPLVEPLNDPDVATVRTPLADDFYVWQNRKALSGEAVLTWDRTGATYFHDWNNVDREESPASASLGLLYDFYQGPTDAYQFHDGVLMAFTKGLPEAKGTWSLQSRVAGRPYPGVRMALSATAGRLQSIGEDPRIVQFWRANGQASWGRLVVEGSYAQNAWGVFGWNREFNMTYPVQWTAGAAWSLKPVSFLSDTDRVGLRFSNWSIDPDLTVTDAEQTGGSKNYRFMAELYAGWSF